MAETARAENINRFVAGARRLIVIQIIVALIALVAAAVAGFVIYQAVLEQEESKRQAGIAEEKTEAAELAQAEAIDAAAEAEAATEQSRLLAQQLSQARIVLTATSPQDYADAAESLYFALTEEAGASSDPDLLALVATAYYKSAEGLGDELLKNAESLSEADRINLEQRIKLVRQPDLVSAANAALGAVQADLARSDVGEATDGRDVARSAGLVMDYLGIACAVAQAGESNNKTAADNMQSYLGEQGLGAIELPERIRVDVGVRLRTRQNSLVKTECGSDLLEVIWASETLAVEGIAPENPFEIKKVFLHISRDQDRPVSSAIANDLSGQPGLQVPGTELIETNYQPSVRYYYDEQLDEAERLRGEILAAAAAAGATAWNEDALPLIKVNMRDLPRDRIEVWLPQVGGKAPELLRNIRVKYFQRPGDGPDVRLVLQRLLPEDRYEISTPFIENNRANMMACDRNAPPAAFADFKTLAIALIDAGVPLRRIAAFERSNLGIDSVQILASNRAVGEDLLTVTYVEQLNSCPAD